MQNKTINLAIVEKVAMALSELKDEMVFVGGAVISLYADESSADEIRPTKDIDLTIRLKTYSSFTKMQERLSALKFYPDPFGVSMCSYKFEDISVDIMPSDSELLGITNRWYDQGIENSIIHNLKNIEIKILSPPFFLATKFEAFNDRGKDYRTSHDFEDIIYIIDNRKSIVKEIENCNLEAKQFLIEEFNKFKKRNDFVEILSAHVHPFIATERIPIIQEKINKIIEMN